MSSIKWTSIVSMALILASASLQAQAPQYNITVLPSTSEMQLFSVTAENLNSLGEVVGWYRNSTSGLQNAFVYANGTMVGLTDFIQGEPNIAYDINDKGEIVGQLDIAHIDDLDDGGPQCNSGGGGDMRAFVFSFSEGRTIISPNGTLGSWAYAINNAGQISGAVYSNCEAACCLAGGICPAIFLKNGTTIGLGSYGSAAGGYDINDYYTTDGLGQVVGYGQDEDYHLNEYAFLYTNAAKTNISSIVCARGKSAASSGTAAYAINNVGQAVGYVKGSCTNAQGNVGFIYNSNHTSAQYLKQGYIPADINDSGWIIGSFEATSGYPFLLIDNTTYNLYDLILSNPGISGLEPVAINNQGQIVANSDIGAVLLTPIEPAP